MKFDISVDFEGKLLDIENIRFRFRPSEKGEYEIDPNKNVLFLIRFYIEAYSYSETVDVKILKVGTFEDYEEFEKEAKRIAKKKSSDSFVLHLISSPCTIEERFSEFF